MIVIVYEACGDLAMSNNVVIIYLCAGHTKTKWHLSSKAFILYDKQILFSLATFWYLPVSTFSLSVSLRSWVKSCTIMWKSRYFSTQNSNIYSL
jgi:hypothetical protein